MDKGRRIAAGLGLLVLVVSFTYHQCNWWVDRPSECVQRWFK